MAFYTIVKHDLGIQVLCFHGRITFGWETEGCRLKLKELLSQGERKYVFDLGDVQYVDSAGIGFLVSCLITLWQGGAYLRLAEAPERVVHVLEITRLRTVFEVFPSREAALQGFH